VVGQSVVTRPAQRPPTALAALGTDRPPPAPRAKKPVWLGLINADTEDEAIERAAIEFKVAAHRLVAKRWS
jgi:hypothetical protein